MLERQATSRPAVAVEDRGIPALIEGPWTEEARQRAVEKESQQVFADFFTRSVPKRIWEPLRDLPIDEMHALSSKLSRHTIDLLEGFMGVEEYVGDYVEHGLDSCRDTPQRRRLLLQWGAEEGRHGAALHQVLLHSGARTEEQLDEYTAKLAERRWSPTQHKGVDSPLGAFVYTTFQERATYVNYVELRRRIRDEYGLPDHTTPEESRRGTEFGASEALRRIALDEIAHHSVFLGILRIHLRYFPDRTLDKIAEIVASFAMPALKLIPSRRHFISALLRTQLYGEAKHEEQVVKPVMKLLGLPAPGQPA